MSTVPQPENHRRSVKVFLGALIAGLAAGGAMFLWIFLNAMGHFNFGYWPVWYAGCAGFLVAALLFFRSARLARQWGQRRVWYEVVAYVLAVGCGAMSVWGVVIAIGMQRPRYEGRSHPSQSSCIRSDSVYS